MGEERKRTGGGGKEHNIVIEKGRHTHKHDYLGKTDPALTVVTG